MNILLDTLAGLRGAVKQKPYRGRIISGGQYINPARQAKKAEMKRLGIKSGKQFRKIEKRMRRMQREEAARAAAAA